MLRLRLWLAVGKMSKGPTHIYVLVEDQAQQILIRRFLKLIQRDSAARYEPLPSGAGSGEQYVRKNLPSLLKKLQSSLGHRVSAIAIVMIDADGMTVTERKNQLQLDHADSSRLAVLIPKRNVETWVGALLGTDLGEDLDYKSQFGDTAEIKQAAERLHRWIKFSELLSNSAPPSLIQSEVEWKKIN